MYGLNSSLDLQLHQYLFHILWDSSRFPRMIAVSVTAKLYNLIINWFLVDVCLTDRSLSKKIHDYTLYFVGLRENRKIFLLLCYVQKLYTNYDDKITFFYHKFYLLFRHIFFLEIVIFFVFLPNNIFTVTIFTSIYPLRLYIYIYIYVGSACLCVFARVRACVRVSVVGVFGRNWIGTYMFLCLSFWIESPFTWTLLLRNYPHHLWEPYIPARAPVET